ncbi:MAG: nucleotidyltransferase family protein [Dongiaceae bacterium]
MGARASFGFLCALLSFAPPEPRRPALLRTIETGRLSAPWLVRLASDHQVAPAVRGALRRLALEAALPAELVDYFDGMETLNRQRNAALRAEALAVARLLAGIGVEPVFLKGTADLLTGDRDPAERFQIDLDLLVPADQLAACARHLQEQGYLPQLHTRSPLAHHAAPLWRPGGPAWIELHHVPLAYPGTVLLPAGELLARARRLGVDGVAVRVPATQDRLVHAIAHAGVTDLGMAYGRAELRLLQDLGHLGRVAGDADWTAVRGRLARHGRGGLLDAYLIAARDLLAAPLPAPAAASRRARLLAARACRQGGHPRLAAAQERLLRPPLLLGRALSHPALRRQLLLNLVDPGWLARHFRRLAG